MATESALDQLRKFSTVVADLADTAEFEQLAKINPLPQVASTSASLILKAANDPNYQRLITDAIEYAKQNAPGTPEEVCTLAVDKLFVLFGKEILKIVKGRVSTEVDARLAFDKEASIKKARKFIELYEKEDIDKEHILITLCSTWEGIQAAKELEAKHGIHCNMTLMCNRFQAYACAQAKVTLVSPLVYWHVKNTDEKEFTRDSDPGVQLVRHIYIYNKKHEHATEVMAASFRDTEQIKGLVGCDLLAISPALLAQLERDTEKLTPALRWDQPEGLKPVVPPEEQIDEEKFRRELSEDAMANDKLSEGIQQFAADAKKLEELIKERL